MCLVTAPSRNGASSDHSACFLLQISNIRDLEAITFKNLVRGHAYSVTAAKQVFPGWGHLTWVVGGGFSFLTSWDNHPVVYIDVYPK